LVILTSKQATNRIGFLIMGFFLMIYSNPKTAFISKGV